MFLENLQKTYPFPFSSALDYFHETQVIADIKFELVGVISEVNSKSITGSAVGFDIESTQLRSYFELLERATLVSKQKTITTDSSDSTWRLSLSNGVAAHTSLQAAQLAARNELFERDLILRSWFGQQKPIPVNIDAHLENEQLGNLLSAYIINAYSFNDSPSEHRPHVIGVFAWPLDSTKCPVYGFGCHSDVVTSISKAINECVQRLCFLYDSTIPDTPATAPTPDMHQDYFLSLQGQTHLKRWLDGHTYNPKATQLPELTTKSITFEDITPDFCKESFYVVSASSPAAVPLYFGEGASSPGERLFGPLTEEMRIHPIC